MKSKRIFTSPVQNRTLEILSITVGIVIVTFAIVILVPELHFNISEVTGKAPSGVVNTAFPTITTEIVKSAPPLTAQQVAEMESKLSNGSDADINSIIIQHAGEDPLPVGFAKQIASYGPISLDAATFHDSNEGTATIKAHLANPPMGVNQDLQVFLKTVDNQWKIDDVQ